ncbi:MAG: DUF1629 domain-containing protein [Pseudomonadota bacterium]
MSEPEAEVWLGDCLTNPEHIAFYRHDEPQDFNGLVDGLRRADPLTSDQLPSKIWPKDVRNAERGERVKRIRNFARATGGMTVISPKFAALLREFDLGVADGAGSDSRCVQLHPIEQLTAENGKLVGQLYLLHVATQKESLISRLSTGVSITETKKGPFVNIHSLERVSLMLSRESLHGPDIWREKWLRRGILFSDRLVRAMQAAKIREISFQPCTIVDQPDGATNA